MSLAGAQHKLAVVLRAGKLFEPNIAAVSTHILKPDHPDSDHVSSVINEWFVMQLAHRLGLAVPKTHRLYVPSPVYVVDRFDRLQQTNKTTRIHSIDACQLLGLSRQYKYRNGSVEALLELANLCRSPAATKIRLFSWIVFNCLTGNTDAHLKNLSFLVSQEGITLAPFYDLLSNAVYETRTFERNEWPEQTQLAWPLLGVNHLNDVNTALLMDVGKTMQISDATTHRLIQAQCSRIFTEATSLIASIEQQNTDIQTKNTSTNIGITLTSELRCLLAITHIVIKQRVSALKS